MYEQYRELPDAGGMNAQNAVRMAHMEAARRVLALRRKEYNSKDYAADMTKEDSELASWLDKATRLLTQQRESNRVWQHKT